MPGGRLNIKGRLEPGKPDPTRKILPREPNYLKDADRFKERLRAKEVKKKERHKEVKEKSEGRRQTSYVIKNLNFVLQYSSYKGKPLAYVIKRDPQFVRNLVKSGDYDISNDVMKELIQRGIIKGV